MKTFALTLVIVFFSLAKGGLAIAGGLAEVVLKEALDDERGYCLDIRGYKTRAKPERGLQAHSCYSYQGALGEDQAMDAAKIKAGVFEIKWYRVCMEAHEPADGTTVKLTTCTASPAQQFILTAAGNIQRRQATNLCLTVAAGEPRQGGGGNPVHLMRSLRFEECSDHRRTYQAWRLRSTAD